MIPESETPKEFTVVLQDISSYLHQVCFILCSTVWREVSKGSVTDDAAQQCLSKLHFFRPHSVTVVRTEKEFLDDMIHLIGLHC